MNFLKKTKTMFKIIIFLLCCLNFYLLLKRHFINTTTLFLLQVLQKCSFEYFKSKEKSLLFADIYFLHLAEMACEIWKETNECQRKYANKGLRHYENHLTSAKKVKSNLVYSYTYLFCIGKKIILASNLKM